MLGDVEPLKELQDAATRARIVARILDEYPRRILHEGESFYRMRKQPAEPAEPASYDSPPDEHLGAGRFDSRDFPVLYGSQDLQVCLHECRVAAEDDVYVATLTAAKDLKLLDLAVVLPEEHVTEFESLDMAVYMLFLAASHSYEIARAIAQAAHAAQFDGLIYPSYFTLLRTGAMPFETAYGISLRRYPSQQVYQESRTIRNLALFGRPLHDGKVGLHSINRVILSRVGYDVHFGPIGV